jgi:HEAT repeat protein
MAKKDPAEASRLRLGVIQLLITENGERVKDTQPGFWPEERSDYYASLVEIVSDFNDEHAIPALLGAITTGNMAASGLARFGERSVAPLLEQLHSADRYVRSSSLFAISKLFETNQTVSRGSYTLIESAIQASLTDPEGNVRYAAVSAVESLPSRDKFVPTLQKIAKQDSWAVPTRTGGEGYPVRLLAQRILDNISHHVPPPKQ